MEARYDVVWHKSGGAFLSQRQELFLSECKGFIKVCFFDRENSLIMNQI